MNIEESAELADRRFAQARSDSIALGQRFVPNRTSRDFWCVIDAQSETIISSGLTFAVAFEKALELSEHDKNQPT